MIIINSGKMKIPEKERFIGFAGDNLHIQRQFLLDSVHDENAIYRLYLTFDDGTVNYLVLDSEIIDGSTQLNWNIASDHIFKSGIVQAQIKVFCSGDEVYHTASDYFIVGDSAEFASYFSIKENSEYLEYEKNLNEIADFIKSHDGIDTTNLVPASRMIAGLPLDKNITKDELLNALRNMLHGSHAPTTSTVGIAGQLYYQENTNPAKLYVCVGNNSNEYKWVEITSSLDTSDIDLSNYVPNTRKIAGLSLDENIDKEDLKYALRTYKTGMGAPSIDTLANLADIYIDTLTLDVYICCGSKNGSMMWKKLNIEDSIGDIEHALDSIIEIQNSVLGGD